MYFAAPDVLEPPFLANTLIFSKLNIYCFLIRPAETRAGSKSTDPEKRPVVAPRFLGQACFPLT
jgi:hypothetical protein